MEFTLPGTVVHLALFFSILFLYCIVDLGRIKYCVLEGHPQSYKKRKAPEQIQEEEEEEEEEVLVEDLISTPVDISEVNDTVEEDLISTPVDISDEQVDIDSIKKEIESTCNFATASEGVAALKNNPSEIMERLQTGFDMWEQRTGKKGMTYSEMREMFG